MIKRILPYAVASVLVAVACTRGPETPATASGFDVLVFSKTVGYRHGDAIAVGTRAIRELGAANGFTVAATEDAGAFTPENLARYEAVVFLNTTTKTKVQSSRLFTDGQRAAFESYIRAGGGFVGVHSAADTEHGWPFYGALVGAYFDHHPAIQQARISVETRATGATAHLPPTWTRIDEWYDFQTNPRSTARVLATLDESSYTGAQMGADHPHIWCKTYQGGRSFYIGGGHTPESYGEPAFRTVLTEALRYAAGHTKIDCRPGSRRR